MLVSFFLFIIFFSSNVIHSSTDILRMSFAVWYDWMAQSFSLSPSSKNGEGENDAKCHFFFCLPKVISPILVTCATCSRAASSSSGRLAGCTVAAGGITASKVLTSLLAKRVITS